MRTEPAKPCPGGTRDGAGRKSTYGEPTKTLRVPQIAVSGVVGYLHELKRSPQAPGDAAGLRPVSAPRESTPVPALGRRVRAGKPTSGDDYPEDAVDLGKHLVRDPSTTFVMKVDGWSMRDAGIADGDELVVDRGVVPADSRIVVADVDGELAAKRLKRTSAGWLLQAANRDFADLPVGDKSKLNIWAL